PKPLYAIYPSGTYKYEGDPLALKSTPETPSSFMPPLSVHEAPEPGWWLQLSSGLAGLLALEHRRRKRSLGRVRRDPGQVR
ncbi:MAG: hypothetical protein VCC04_09055, partial [Myxococcota bacterium]